MMPLISILIPAYNADRWISDTIRSALNQTWENTEIIVVDDGSTDDTLALARHFESRNIKVVTQDNQGASGARNTALSLAQGDYIQWLDADDLLAPDKIEAQMRARGGDQTERTLFSGAWSFFYYRPASAKFFPSPLWTDLSPVEWLLRKLRYNLFMHPATWLVSRRLTADAGGWNTQLWKDNDGEYFCRILLASDGSRFIPTARTYYRRPSAKNVSYVGRSARKLESLWLSMQLHIRYLRSLEESERVREACIEYLQRCFPFFYPERTDIIRQMRALAASLGGNLATPRLSWKYAWIQRTFGWTTAKRAQLLLPETKLILLKTLDRLRLVLEGGNPGVFSNTSKSECAP